MDTKTEILPALLRISDAALVLAVSKSKLYELIAKGRIPSIRIGGSLRIPRQGLQNWIEEQTAQISGGEI